MLCFATERLIREQQDGARRTLRLPRKQAEGRREYYGDDYQQDSQKRAQDGVKRGSGQALDG